ncbi:MAG TPA: Clp protease N-terminal domain-containing protein [Gaiellaceae bacterium]|nr:Clp protease N-terminal domain-containing protein [Gaiellaceae bacterium]
MFTRFTEQAREAVALAQDEARSLGHSAVGTDHLLVGLLREATGAAARMLDGLDVTVEEVRAQTERCVGRGDGSPAGETPFADDAKRAFELAMREALSLGHNYIATEHLLLGVAREGGAATRILVGFDADLETIRAEVVRLLQGVSPDASARTEGDGEEAQIVVDLAGLEGWSAPARRPPALRMLALGAGLFALAFGLGLLVGRRTRG